MLSDYERGLHRRHEAAILGVQNYSLPRAVTFHLSFFIILSSVPIFPTGSTFPFVFSSVLSHSALQPFSGMPLPRAEQLCCDGNAVEMKPLQSFLPTRHSSNTGPRVCSPILSIHLWWVTSDPSRQQMLLISVTCESIVLYCIVFYQAITGFLEGEPSCAGPHRCDGER